jgi:eukaryotic-like serine/threonine-protein kinase
MDLVRAKRITAELRGRRVGAWTIGDYLGNGASAVVLSAERDGKVAALKLIDPEMVERYGVDRQLARIERERELIGKSEPHLVQIFDGGRCPDTDYLYVAMELIPHPALTSLIRVFPTDRIGPVIRQLAGATRFLEAEHLVHRDIKPDNIAIMRDFSRAKLLDLGVVRPIGHHAYEDAGSGDAFLGTTRYSPPEYLMREEEDSEDGWRAVTFYQLGAVLHDMIMRRRLFDEIEAPPARLIEAVRMARPVIDSPNVAPHLISLARNCLQKDWKLRLELVRWEDFVESPPPALSGDAKDRIQRRIAAGPGRVTAAAPSPTPSAKTRRRLLEQLGGSVASTIREICLQSGTFPPIEVRHTHSDTGRLVSLTTGPSETYALQATLHVQVHVSALDDDGQIVQLRGVAAIDTIHSDIEPDVRVRIYAGDFSAPALRDRLDDFLHLALDAAQNASGSAATPLLPLRPLG